MDLKLVLQRITLLESQKRSSKSLVSLLSSSILKSELERLLSTIRRGIICRERLDLTECLICVVHSYDFDTLDKIPQDKVVIFVVSSA